MKCRRGRVGAEEGGGENGVVRKAAEVGEEVKMRNGILAYGGWRHAWEHMGGLKARRRKRVKNREGE